MVILMIVLLSNHPGQSITKPKIVLLPLIDTGLSLTEKQAYQSAIEDALSRQYVVFSGNQVLEALKKQTEFECAADACMQNIAIEFQGELIARGTVKPNSK